MRQDTHRRLHARPRRRKQAAARVIAPIALVVVAIVVVVLVLTSHSKPKAANGQPETTSSSAISPSNPTTTLADSTTTEPISSTTTTSVPSPTTTTTLVPAEISVEVLNGVGGKGAAASAANGLSARGFVIKGTTDAAQFDYPVTTIRYPLGLEQAAQTVAKYVIGSTSLVADSTLTGSTIEVIVGTSFQGVSGT